MVLKLSVYSDLMSQIFLPGPSSTWKLEAESKLIGQINCGKGNLSQWKIENRSKTEEKEANPKREALLF